MTVGDAHARSVDKPRSLCEALGRVRPDPVASKSMRKPPGGSSADLRGTQNDDPQRPRRERPSRVQIGRSEW